MVSSQIKKRIFSVTSLVTVAVVFVHLAIMPFLYRTIANTYKDSAYEQFVGHVTEVAGLLADVLSTKSLENDRDGIVKILDTAVLGGNVQFIEIVSHQGDVIRPRDGVLLSTDDFKEDVGVNNNGDDVYHLSVPVYFTDDKEKVSSLRLGFDESAVINDYALIQRKVELVLAGYLAVFIILIAVILRIIHRPLYQLRDLSREIAKGNIEVPLGTTSKISEIKYLADDLDEMRRSLVSLAEHMQHKATHDELTGLPNRYLFNDRLEQVIAMSERENKQFAILLLDLDRFKEINDTIGHSVGDEVLRIAASRMQEGLRVTDTVARLGGDEFSFILVGVGQVLAERMARKILELIEPAFKINHHSLNVGVSIGISVYPDDGTNADLLMRRADVAMYSAKHNNSKLASYYSDMDSDHYENLMLSNDLKNSIINDHFEPLFQPKIDLLTGKPCGCELLLRWYHPYLGLIYPDKFIPIAERENLIGELTRWAISHYLHLFCDLIEVDKDFRVSINVSPVDLLDNTLFNSIRDTLEHIGFPAQNLCIEVTENAIMKNTARSEEVLGKFHDYGVMVSVDDFGTGYSSLAYLQKFPISELKIDKTFVTDLAENSANQSVVGATITMAHDLGISVVAEGVEDKAVLQELVSMGCDRAQGFLYAEPLVIEDMVKWIQSYKNNSTEKV
jgi:diguanylate cyclase (GGDEF)-like protein